MITGTSGANWKEERDMSRFNTRNHQSKPAVATVTSPVGTTSRKTADTRTYNGGAGWMKTPQTELFLRLTAAFSGGQKSFYESAEARDERLVTLTHKLAVEDPEFVFNLARWARTEGNVRTGSLMVAAEFVKARLDAGLTGVVGTRVGDPDKQWATVSSRAIIDAVCQRADEPGELLAYWLAVYGRRVPKPVKRGLADAVQRLYTQRSALKYDTASHSIRFGDVLELVHAGPHPDKAAWQGDLFKFVIDRRHGNVNGIPESLTLLRRNELLRSEGEPQDWLNADVLREAGMTWEDALSAVGSKVDKAKLWEALIPSMGYMALLRNLRNFDEAGVSDHVAQQVIAKITDPAEVASSRQFPFRFLAAYKHAPSLRWSYPLEQALGYSLANVPVLPGHTLVLVDRSGSMQVPQSDRSQLTRGEAAAIFGTALALRAEHADLVQFGTNHSKVQFGRGESVLRILQRYSWLGGTNTAAAVQAHFAGHDRVVIVTDEQTSFYYGDPGQMVPKDVPMYTWNLAGYAQSHMPSGGEARFTFGGLTDKAFTMIPLMESGQNGVWPWDVDSAE